MNDSYPTEEQKQQVKSQDDHDILVALGVDMLWVRKQISNHLAHHTKYEVALVVAILLMVIERLIT